MSLDLSIIIPFIHEYPNIYGTVNNIQTELKDCNYSWEIIVVENGTVDENTPKAFTGPRALYRAIMGDKIRYVFEPNQCGPVARNSGARIARGKYLMFMDAHTTLGKNSIEPLIETLEKDSDCGCVSGLTAWSNYNKERLGSYYELFGGHGGPTLLTHMHGHYMPFGRVKSDKPFLAVMGSQAYTIYRKKDFFDVGGYFDGARFYPHPEGYMPIKIWMCGKSVKINPDSWHLHGMFHRHYQKGDAEKRIEMIKFAETIEEVREILQEPTTDDGHEKRQEYGGLSWHEHGKRNVLMIAYILGEEKWLNLCKEAVQASNELVESAKETVHKYPAYKLLREKEVYGLDELLTTARYSNHLDDTDEKIWGMEKWDKRIGVDPL